MGDRSAHRCTDGWVTGTQEGRSGEVDVFDAGMIAGAVIMVAVGTAYLLWVRGHLRAPFPTDPHRFDPQEAVRFLGTARVGDTTASLPRGEMVVDRDAVLVRAQAPKGEAVVLLRRGQVRAVHIRGGRGARRVSFVPVGRGDAAVEDLLFGAALLDPAPTMIELGWPVTEH